MSNRPTKKRIQINSRLTPIQVSQLDDLTQLYGSQSRALTAAIELLWRSTAEERAKFLPAAAGVATDDDADATPPTE